MSPVGLIIFIDLIIIIIFLVESNYFINTNQTGFIDLIGLAWCLGYGSSNSPLKVKVSTVETILLSVEYTTRFINLDDKISLLLLNSFILLYRTLIIR